jgi:hypothetical protein
VAHISRLLAEGPALIVALLLSTIATIAVTSLIVAGWRGAVALRDVSEGEQHGT